MQDKPKNPQSDRPPAKKVEYPPGMRPRDLKALRRAEKRREILAASENNNTTLHPLPAPGSHKNWLVPTPRSVVESGSEPRLYNRSSRNSVPIEEP